MAEPVRIQLSRAKGWRMPPGTVRVARPGLWGNKFRVGDTVQRFSAERICETMQVADAAQAVELYREWIELCLAQHPEIMRPALDELRGKNLACWCPLPKPGEPDVCHAAVLLRIANEGGGHG